MTTKPTTPGLRPPRWEEIRAYYTGEGDPS